jgi:ribosomal-protein-alanine N-acetyltransferase
MQKVSIRWLIKKDMRFVLRIQESLEFPWTETDFLEALGNTNCIGMVAEINNEIAGYMIYELYREYFYIVNLAVKETLRKQKVGSQLVNMLQDRLSHHRRTSINTNIRESQLSVQFFLKSLGFKATLIRDYYENEDSYYFRYRLKEEHGDI